MKTLSMSLVSLALIAGASLAVTAHAAGSSFDEELVSIQQEFDRANFSGLDKGQRRSAFEALVEHAGDFSDRYPDRAEALAWNGIVLSSFAGEVSALGAMKYAKAAREALHAAEAMNPEALDGGIYASLGALYSKVPGGLMGFGDDALAAEYFIKALAVDPANIDSNYFYGEFLLEHGDHASATEVLRRALDAPRVAARPLFDAGRREMIRDLLGDAEAA